MKVHDGKLYRYLDIGTSEPGPWQPVVPQSLRKEVFDQVHGSPTCEHFGVKKTLARIRERLWSSCRQSVEEWCRNYKAPGKKHKGPMKHKGPVKQFNVGAPLERVALDILGPLPTSQTPRSGLMFAREVYLPVSILCRPPDEQKFETVGDQLRKTMENVNENARMRIPMASDQMKLRYDVGSTRETFKLSGDAVWLCNSQRKKGLSPKLSND